VAGPPILTKIGTQTMTATVTEPKYEVNVNTLEQLPSRTLSLNAIGVVNISIDRAIPFEAYEDNPDLGGFILIDRISNATVAAGMVHFALRRSHNIHWQALDVDRQAHAGAKNQTAKVVWLT